MLRLMSFEEIEAATTGALLRITSLCFEAEDQLVKMLNQHLHGDYKPVLTTDEIIDRQVNAIYTRKRAASELRKRIQF